MSRYGLLPTYNRTVLSGSQVSVVTILKAVQPKDGYGILDYSHGIKQQNSKDLSEREFGEHKWYDPHTGKMDDAGSNYAGRKRKPRYD